MMTESEYENAMHVIANLNKFFPDNPKPGTPDGDYINRLVDRVVDYENFHFPFNIK